MMSLFQGSLRVHPVLAVNGSRWCRSSVVGGDSSVGHRCGSGCRTGPGLSVESGHQLAVSGPRRVELVFAFCQLTALLCGVLFQLSDAPV